MRPSDSSESEADSSPLESQDMEERFSNSSQKKDRKLRKFKQKVAKDNGKYKIVERKVLSS